ncbi:MAG: carbamoyltransferase HypF [Paracoccaceae bacterium]
MQGWQIRVRGLVQGVGFRPHVWRIAHQFGLHGMVLNDTSGVVIELFCDEIMRARFECALREDAPPLARIDAVETNIIDKQSPSAFTIVASRSGKANTGITPDAATCSACLQDIFDLENRRYLYPFTNCTHCGPRLTITKKIPYDRANTAMAVFPMCSACQAEYENPGDRRYHAQPNACPDCGPNLKLLDASGIPMVGDPLEKVASLIRDGKIVAIKGLGGFQLAVDARNEAAVTRLRNQKHRPAKPLALMVRNIEMAARLVAVPQAARDLMSNWQAPIVLLDRIGTIADSVAPGQTRLGVMLPNTPLHHILLNILDGPIVMTSGNIAGDPQITENAEAMKKLANIADYFLCHNREIINRMDDSVLQLIGSAPQILRRARGYAPAPLVLHKGFSELTPTLAMGGDLKNTFCLLGQGRAIVSQHMGDMDNAATQRDVRDNLALYRQIYSFTPAQVAVDAHSGYFSTRLGEKLAVKHGSILLRVQHHHAHVAAVMAEHGMPPDAPPVLAVVLDGLGFGTDGTIWGGEFLLTDFKTSTRLEHFPEVALLGGDKASHQPWRNLFTHLRSAFGPDDWQSRLGTLPVLKKLAAKPLPMLDQMIEKGLNSPTASSAGRLFDAVAAFLGVNFEQIEFEGQAAMQVQALAEAAWDEAGYYALNDTNSWRNLWTGMISDLRKGVSRNVIAKRFHNSLARVITQIATDLSESSGTEKIVLSGGVFQNRLLLNGVNSALTRKGYTVLQPFVLPLNDGGLSLGQAAIAASKD